MTVDKLRAHYGLTRTPFSRSIAPSQIFAARTHKEAVARLRWLVAETAMGVVTGEVGAGKTIAARAAVAGLDASGSPWSTCPTPWSAPRGIHHHLVTALGDIPKFHRPALIAQTQDLLADETEERRKTVVLIVDEAYLLSTEQLEQLRLLTNTDMDSRSSLGLILLGQPPPATAAETRPLRRARSAHQPAVPPRRAPGRRHRRLHRPPSRPGRPVRSAVLRRRHRPDPPDLTRDPAGDQQPRRPGADRRLRRQQGHRRRDLRPRRRHRGHRRLNPSASRAPATAGAHPLPAPDRLLTERVTVVLIGHGARQVRSWRMPVCLARGDHR